MAILGFLAHAPNGQAAEVESFLKNFEQLTTYGIHKNDYVVAVAEAKADDMEKLFDDVKNIPGIIAVYVTSFTTEDELPEQE